MTDAGFPRKVTGLLPNVGASNLNIKADCRELTTPPMNDSKTAIAELRKIVERFVDERDWHRFHTPKNLAMSLAIEAAELMEHFQWLTPVQSWAVAEEQDKRSAVADELADVFCYLLAMANELGVDLSSALAEKMVKNERKYPACEYRGRFGPDDPTPAEKG